MLDADDMVRKRIYRPAVTSDEVSRLERDIYLAIGQAHANKEIVRLWTIHRYMDTDPGMTLIPEKELESRIGIMVREGKLYREKSMFGYLYSLPEAAGAYPQP